MTDDKQIRTVLTGADGAIGTVLADKLRAAGHRVFCISRRQGYDLTGEYTRNWLAHHDCDLVIHAAATPHDRENHLLDVLQNDIEATLGALHAGRKMAKPPHFVLLSSIAVYEKAPGQAFDRVRPLVEDDTLGIPPPDAPFGLAKLLAERAVEAWHTRTGGTYTIWRLSNVISPFAPHDKPAGLVTDLYREILGDRLTELHLGAAGFHLRSFSWVGEIADAIIKHVADPMASNRTFNLGSSEQTSIVDLARTMIEAGHQLGILPAHYRPEIVFDSGGVRGDDQAVRIPSIERARAELGWTPEATLRDMIATFILYKIGIADHGGVQVPLHLVAGRTRV